MVRVQWGAENIVLDVTICCPGTEASINAGSNLFPDIASGLAEQSKRLHYEDIPNIVVDPISNECNFVPFAIESTGRLGPASIKFLDKYSEFCGVSTRTKNALVSSVVASIQFHGPKTINAVSCSGDCCYTSGGFGVGIGVPS